MGWGWRVCPWPWTLPSPQPRSGISGICWSGGLQGNPCNTSWGNGNSWACPFMWGRMALIPRPDTETLCEAVLARRPKGRGVKLLDLCCGTGCIGLSLGKLGGFTPTLTDISPQCLALAQRNARLQPGGSPVFPGGPVCRPAPGGNLWGDLRQSPLYSRRGDPRPTAGGKPRAPAGPGRGAGRPGLLPAHRPRIQGAFWPRGACWPWSWGPGNSRRYRPCLGAGPP